jgi:lipoprotein-releasing system ATP-binding protein
MSKPALVIRGLTRSYVAGERTLEVLKGIDLEVRPGELVGLVGPSGSGKSSLLHAAGLLEHPTAGTIIVNGADSSGSK